MPEFPVHQYGTSEMMKWMLPALQARGERKTTWETAKQKRQKEFLGKEVEAGTFRGEAPTGPRGPFPGGRFAQPTQAGQQAEALFGPGGRQRAQTMALQNKARINEEMENNKLTRKLKMVEGVNKQIDWTVKQVKEGGVDPTTHQNLINLGNKNAQGLLGVNIGLTVADDAKAITQKWKTGAYKSLIQEPLQAFEAEPTAGTHARLAMSIDKMANLTGEKFEALKMSANKTMTEARKKWEPKTKAEALEIKRAGATRMTIGDIGARREATMKADIKSPKFRADIIRNVKALDPDFIYKSPNEKKLAIRQEADRQIKGPYPGAVFDLRNNVLGWYDDNKLVRAWKD